MTKKVGGLKRRKRLARESPSTKEKTKRATKKAGGLKRRKRERPALEWTPRTVCPGGCVGFWRHNTWYHTHGCEYTVVGNKHLGFTAEDWNCLHGCPPLEIPSGFTHQYDCEFWDDDDWRPVYPNFPDEGPTPF